MPEYTYRCPHCEKVVLILLPLSRFDEEQSCTECGETMKRIPSSGIGGFVH